MLHETATDQIADRIRMGDKQAFEQLFRQHYQHLCNFAHQYLEEKLASEEVVQEVFFKLWDNREQLNITSSVKSYLFTAVRNHCLNQIKHLKIRDTYKAENELTIKYDEQNAGDAVLAGELEERIGAAVASLPPERQKIFKMSRYEDKKYKEIADELSLSVKTVEAQMGKALKFLREQLADYLPLFLLGIWWSIKNFFN